MRVGIKTIGIVAIAVLLFTNVFMFYLLYSQRQAHDAQEGNLYYALLATAPLWSDIGLVNPTRAEATTNKSSATAIMQFYEEHLVNIRENCPIRYTEFCCARDEKISRDFQQLLIDGFRYDNLAKTKPFTWEYVYMVLNNVYFYFAKNYNGQTRAGSYTAGRSSNLSHLYVSTEKPSPYWFAFTVFHELGHAFGLGETLSNLLAEQFLGLDRPLMTWRNLAYNPTFDRILLQKVGAIRLWDAAFYSNAAFGKLWDEYFGHIVTHDEIQIVRGVYLTSMLRAETAASFERFSKTTLRKSFDIIYTNFKRLTGIYGQPMNDTVRRTVQNELRQEVDMFLRFAKRQSNIRTSASVLDWVLCNHRYRYNLTRNQSRNR
ncbi:MAG: hypothetical protein FWC32_12070 [Firmicutes bacterium]|nr:hypothetical protein [Bacillota bacterium]